MTTIKLTAAQQRVLDAVKAGRVYRSDSSHDLYNTYMVNEDGRRTRVQDRTLDPLVDAGLIHIGPHEGFKRPWLAGGWATTETVVE